MTNKSLATVGLVITALDETDSLRQTIAVVLDADKDRRIVDIILATSPKSTPECLEAVAEMVAKHEGLVREHRQERLPGVGGAVRECLEIVQGEWFLMMASDLETPPENVNDFLARIDQGDVDIVTSSRWMHGGEFGDYSKVKLVCNWIFQKFFSLLYLASLTDMTYGYRACRAELASRYVWKETGHAFFFENLVKPLRDGKKVVEIPVKWRRRIEGESHIKATEYLRYFKIGLQVRFLPLKRLLQQSD